MGEKELEDKIKELENKLKQLNHASKPKPKWMSEEKEPFDYVDEDNELEIGEDKFDTMKEISKTKKQVIPRAGTIPTTEDGNVSADDNVEPVKIPDEGIHEFTNLEECECECHPKKQDCIDCYDHPIHLEDKRKEPEVEEYDKEKISELIEADKAKKEKKHWWN